ncbi:site-specific integrase [Mucilaginibacter sp.]|uniref:site-specific integrase n=1 Tax=Mucilaginibacter sp. TaxID=1882438 RepID=UPI00262ABBCF|nr:site-specific integrase [Mucilaginibacter sp.]MDB4922811.1 site-specific integrase [Mucilaginibacter sp.]
MKKSRAGLSCYIVIDSRVNPNGLSKILFRIQQARVKRDLYTGIKWPRTFFSQTTQQLLPRNANDPDVQPYNLQINEFKTRAHRMALTGYLEKTDITIDDIVNEFKNMHVAEDFFSFMEVNANELYNQDTIVNGTWRRHKCSLNILKLYYNRETLPIGRLSLELIEKFDAWARTKHKAGHNTVCGYHKDIKKYLSMAVRKCLIAKNPYADFSFAYVDGDRVALNQEEINNLITLFKHPLLEHNDREILRRFLFSCFTGLRISDTGLLNSSMIHGSDLVFIPFKGRSQGKILRLPLQNIAMQLIDGRAGMLFQKFSHGYINERLKIIGARASIFKRLTYHCARDTFGTQAVEMNVHIKLISEMMGHSDLKTTSIYLKMSDAEKRRAMGKFDDRFKL